MVIEDGLGDVLVHKPISGHGSMCASQSGFNVRQALSVLVTICFCCLKCFALVNSMFVFIRSMAKTIYNVG